MSICVVALVGVAGVVVGMLAVWSWMSVKVAGLKAALVAKVGELKAERGRRE